ncbi:hypothetical protein RHRU231_670002 [Rhodococcus ruber]|uniref:Uncharacterized protein n=1 Tax=Rhodococcus ruber TaxID=1830 RepID=A0A098BNR4_9NOCA|nr:hypothetical protein RHRU231_670002 [Rhodococcus ruber]
MPTEGHQDIPTVSMDLLRQPWFSV